jgi:hypothetical protein
MGRVFPPILTYSTFGLADGSCMNPESGNHVAREKNEGGDDATTVKRDKANRKEGASGRNPHSKHNHTPRYIEGRA